MRDALVVLLLACRHCGWLVLVEDENHDAFNMLCIGGTARKMRETHEQTHEKFERNSKDMKRSDGNMQAH